MWNFLKSNLQVEDFIQKHRSEKIKENIKNAKSVVQSNRPQSNKRTNFLKSSKKKQIKEDRELRIFKDNQILLKKMITIDSKPSSIRNNRATSAKYTGRSISRNQNQFKIFEENQRFLKRLQNANSHYCIERFEEENRYQEYLKSNISKKPRRIMKKSERNNTTNDLIHSILQRRELRKDKNEEFND